MITLNPHGTKIATNASWTNDHVEDERSLSEEENVEEGDEGRLRRVHRKPQKGLLLQGGENKVDDVDDFVCASVAVAVDSERWRSARMATSQRSKRKSSSSKESEVGFEEDQQQWGEAEKANKKMKEKEEELAAAVTGQRQRRTDALLRAVRQRETEVVAEWESFLTRIAT